MHYRRMTLPGHERGITIESTNSFMTAYILQNKGQVLKAIEMS